MYRVPKATDNDDRNALDEFEKASKSGFSKKLLKSGESTFRTRQKLLLE